MYMIFALITILSSGDIYGLQSKTTYTTLDACELARGPSEDYLKQMIMEKKGINEDQIKVETACAPAEKGA